MVGQTVLDDVGGVDGLLIVVPLRDDLPPEVHQPVPVVPRHGLQEGPPLFLGGEVGELLVQVYNLDVLPIH